MQPSTRPDIERPSVTAPVAAHDQPSGILERNAHALQPACPLLLPWRSIGETHKEDLPLSPIQCGTIIPPLSMIGAKVNSLTTAADTSLTARPT